MDPSSTRTVPTGLPRHRNVAQKPVAHWIVVLECDRLDAGGAYHALRGFDELRVGRGMHRRFRTVEDAQRRVLYLELPDARLSSAHARLIRQHDGWTLVDCESTNGTFCNGVPVSRCEVHSGDRIQLGHTFCTFRESVEEGSALESYDATSSQRADLAGMDTFSPSNAARLLRLLRIAPSSIPILVRGESGTGKELLARAIHVLSMRPGPFVALNCGAIPSTLIEAQLFGHKKGSFSGAGRDEQGFVRAANFGTLFLDEIGDLPSSSQAALLRVLQQGEVVPIGASAPVPVDVRVVSATHQPLETLIEQGTFREDLYARIAGFVHEAPPLRERLEDMGLLVKALLKAENEEQHLRVRPNVGEAFLRYRWPLNIRELKQCLSSGRLLAENNLLRLSDLPPGVAAAMSASETAASPSTRPNSLAPAGDKLSEEDQQLRAELVRALTDNQGNVSEVARQMGKARQQIQRWMRRLQIERDEYDR